jgi:hypothetical protein
MEWDDAAIAKAMLARMSARYIDPTAKATQGSRGRQPESSRYERANI